MAFIPDRIGSTEQTAFEFITADAATYVVGEALAYSSGVLVAATGTTTPEYISMENRTLAEDGLLCVTRIRPDIVYETTNQANLSATPGAKVTLHTDGLRVTNTTTNGVAEIVSAEAAAATATGKKVYVRFP